MESNSKNGELRVCAFCRVHVFVGRKDAMLSKKEEPSTRKKQADNIWRFLAFVDVDFFLVLGDEVEERLEEPRTVRVRRLWRVCRG